MGRWSLLNQFDVVVNQGKASRYWRVWLVPVDAPRARLCIGAAWTKGKAVERAVAMLNGAETALKAGQHIDPPKQGPLQRLMEDGVT